MKIRVAICLEDPSYTEKLVAYYSVHHREDLEMHTLSDTTALETYLKEYVINVVLLGEGVVLTDGVTGREEYAVIRLIHGKAPDNEPNAIHIKKYQSAELIYKEIMQHGANRDSFVAAGSKEGTRVYAFASVTGGAGASTVSAAFAIHMARRGRSVLYLNLEPFGTTEPVFGAGGHYSFEQVILALKTQRGDLSAKLKSALSRAPEEVFFYAPCKSALDLSQMSAQEADVLIRHVSGQEYDYIVIDFWADLSDRSKAIMGRADHIIMVSDGSELSRHKFERFYRAFEQNDRAEHIRLVDRMKIFNNKFEEGSGRDISNERIGNIGGIPRIRLQGYKEIILHMAGNQSCFAEMR